MTLVTRFTSDTLRRVAQALEAGGHHELASEVAQARTDAMPRPGDEKYRRRSKRYQDEGNLEFDDDAPVSRGEGSGGAYVACWKWISAEDAGVNEDIIADDDEGWDVAGTIDEQIKRFAEIEAEHEFQTTWSILEVEDMDEVPFDDLRTLRYDEHWGARPVAVTFETAPTWLDLWWAADHLIRLSGDQHHIFIEAFRPAGEGAYTLATGS